ncbi:TIGR03936 family radical SAM-associated protein [Pseudothermotoga thermarum]|uniref:DUF2344 domain-containing protein n=1 Tax=Pseudothermotoga thermarum DSM 5069 TaxID=688269 RepID=F7YXN7_9THEM|nr:TIGR03936 family radical SAM-associated protein [Pseudothermotoga thermarum]AEH50681.1 Protein of unknown function DUF2344 [Pseudothermotoga thermarum DSM 5069]
MHVVIKYKKYGLLRFLSAIETANAIERHLRRTGLKMVFSQGFHRKPRISYLDPTPTGVVNLALYVRVEVETFCEKLLDELKKTALPKLYPVSLWWTEVDPNRVVTGYSYRIILDEDCVDLSNYDENKPLKTDKKEGKVGEFFQNLRFKKVGRFLILEYTQTRNKLLHPMYLCKMLMVKEPSVFIVQRTEALCGGKALSELLEESYGKENIGC